MQDGILFGTTASSESTFQKVVCRLGRFLRCLFVAPYEANVLQHDIPCVITDMVHFRKTKYPGMTPADACYDGEGCPGGLVLLKMRGAHDSFQRVVCSKQ